MICKWPFGQEKKVIRIYRKKVNYSDRNFIERLKQRDELAWKDFIGLYENKLVNYARSLSKDYDNSLDIVQHVFIKMYINRNKLDPKKSIQQYLYKSIFNEYLNFKKKTKDTCRLDEHHFFFEKNRFENCSDDEIFQKINMMNKLIHELPTKTKQVFTMSKVRGLSNSEISIKLQIHPKTVEGHITKAFKLLRNNALQPD